MRTAQSKLQPEASTGHTSPLKPNGEGKLQDMSPPQRRRCVKFIHSRKRTDAEHVSTVEPSVAPTKERHLPKKSNRRIHKQHPDARNNDCQIQGHGNNAPDSKCELARTQWRGNTFKSNRRLMHDDGLSPVSQKLPWSRCGGWTRKNTHSPVPHLPRGPMKKQPHPMSYPMKPVLPSVPEPTRQPTS